MQVKTVRTASELSVNLRETMFHKWYTISDLLITGGPGMRRFAAAVLSALMVISLAGCGKQTDTKAQTPLLNAGTYTGTGAGKNGDVKVAVTVNTDSIVNIEVQDNSETAGIADDAIETVPKEILDGQSLAVDTVSGATETSTAILTAVADAITQAGGNPEDWKKAPAASSQAAQPEELTTEVVVIGAGEAGMIATLRLSELGHKVVQLEKTAEAGGALAMSGGAQIVTGSKLQTKAGGEGDSAESLAADLKAYGNSTNNEELLNLFCQNVGSTTDWLYDTCGIEFDMKTGLVSSAEYSSDRVLNYEGGGSKIASTLKEELGVSGAKVMTSTRAIALIHDGGAVTGVIAKDTDSGKVYMIHADAVLLATGGYGNNQNLLQTSYLYAGSDASTGDAQVLIKDAGLTQGTLDTSKLEYYWGAIPVDDTKAVSVREANQAAFTMGAILLNSAGKRFVNETAGDSTVLSAVEATENKDAYLLMDKETFNRWKSKLDVAGVAYSQLSKWMDANGSSEPILAHGDTLSDAASAAGLDPAAVEATVSYYNKSVTMGFDSDYGRAREDMTQALEDGPFYIIQLKPCFTMTLSGVSVNTSLQVLDASSSPISGLYAAGEVAGGVFGDNAPEGAGNAWAATSGKLAADALDAALQEAKAEAGADAGARAEADASASPSASAAAQ